MNYEEQYEQYKALREQTLATPEPEPEEVVERQAETSLWMRHPGTLKYVRELEEDIAKEELHLAALAKQSSDPEVRGSGARLAMLRYMRNKVK